MAVFNPDDPILKRVSDSPKKAPRLSNTESPSGGKDQFHSKVNVIQYRSFFYWKNSRFDFPDWLFVESTRDGRIAFTGAAEEDRNFSLSSACESQRGQ